MRFHASERTLSTNGLPTYMAGPYATPLPPLVFMPSLSGGWSISIMVRHGDRGFVHKYWHAENAERVETLLRSWESNPEKVMEFYFGYDLIATNPLPMPTLPPEAPVAVGPAPGLDFFTKADL